MRLLLFACPEPLPSLFPEHRPGQLERRRGPWFLALPFSSCVISDKFLNLSASQFIHLKKWDAIFKCLVFSKYYIIITRTAEVTGLGTQTLGCGLNTARFSRLPAPMPPPWSRPPSLLTSSHSLLFPSSHQCGAFFLKGKSGHAPLLTEALQRLPLFSG